MSEHLALDVKRKHASERDEQLDYYSSLPQHGGKEKISAFGHPVCSILLPEILELKKILPVLF